MPYPRRSRVALIILDGWGEAPDWGGNAITRSHLVNYPALKKRAACSSLSASGADVGLPGTLPGNSEAGHLNIGAGRIVPQDFSFITKEISSGHLLQNEGIQGLLAHLSQFGGTLHLIGLLSDGGVHSHIDHLLALFDTLKGIPLPRILIHIIADGRDADPRSLPLYLKRIKRNLAPFGRNGPQIASIIGRFYAMDRDNHVDRTIRAINLYLHGAGETVKDIDIWLEAKYRAGLDDQRLPPGRLLTPEDIAISTNDAVLVWNFRPDRSRQLLEGLVTGQVAGTRMSSVPKNVLTATFIPQPQQFPVLRIFEPPAVVNPLGQVLSEAGATQLHAAETEKYAHVTYFFNGGIEMPFKGEERLLIDSGEVKSFDQEPTMRASEIVKKVLKRLESQKFDFVVINFANADMVGHTGKMGPTLTAVETIDQALGQLIPQIEALDYEVVITADHGNAEEMIEPTTGQPDPSHTNHPVPFLLLSPRRYRVRDHGRLADVAPTILNLLGITQPPEMTGESLVANVLH